MGDFPGEGAQGRVRGGGTFGVFQVWNSLGLRLALAKISLCFSSFYWGRSETRYGGGGRE